MRLFEACANSKVRANIQRWPKITDDKQKLKSS